MSYEWEDSDVAIIRELLFLILEDAKERKPKGLLKVVEDGAQGGQ